jgi:hypothetical protein
MIDAAGREACKRFQFAGASSGSQENLQRSAHRDRSIDGMLRFVIAEARARFGSMTATSDASTSAATWQ